MSKENINSEHKKEKSPFTDIFLKLIDGMTQQEVADKVGVSRQNVGLWIRGKTVPDIYTLSKIADAFKVSTDYLLGRTKNSPPDVDLRAVCDYTGLSWKTVSFLQHCANNNIVNNCTENRMPFSIVDWAILNILPETNIDISTALVSIDDAMQNPHLKASINEKIYGIVNRSADKYKLKIDNYLHECCKIVGFDEYSSVMSSIEKEKFEIPMLMFDGKWEKYKKAGD